MEPALIITHLDDRHEGLARECLERAGCPVITANAADAHPLPAIGEVSAIISLGGDQSATRVAEHDFLTAEVALMQGALEREVPILGMCLGAQVLAVAAGGRVSEMGHMYAGWPPLTPLPALADDPVFATLPDDVRVLKWHEDMIELPPGALELGLTPNLGAELFRIGPRAWGSQAHLELVPEMLEGWLTDRRGVAQIEGAGHPIDAFRALSAELLGPQVAAARPVFAAFAALAVTVAVAQPANASRTSQ
jgi:GMP synthase-like glutamine amidotransferase